MSKIWISLFFVASMLAGFFAWNNYTSSKEKAPSFKETIKNEIEKVSHSFTDSRDGKKYRTVTIGTQTWMAENLNFDYGKYGTARCFCFNDMESNCEKYGRLYNLAAVTDSAGFLFDGNICPKGWHLPSWREWETLFSYVGKDGSGIKLKSKSGWMNSGNGTDEFGFTILPGGNRIDRKYGGEGGRSTFWMAVGEIKRSAFYGPDYHVVHVRSSADDIGFVPSGNDNGSYYVRCLKD